MKFDLFASFDRPEYSGELIELEFPEQIADALSAECQNRTPDELFDQSLPRFKSRRDWFCDQTEKLLERRVGFVIVEEAFSFGDSKTNCPYSGHQEAIENVVRPGISQRPGGNLN
jgi:hypothetical protein